MQAPVSLCVVVKNEELFLETCLASAKPYVREMIVVDTGSTDRTVEIAKTLGAKVFCEPWPGDLAKAHDLPVAHASQPWILAMDGDEALDQETGRALAALLECESGLADGYLFTMRNYSFKEMTNARLCDPWHPVSWGAQFWTPSKNVRLYRNHPQYRHEGRLHQTPKHSIERLGGRIDDSEFVIHHYGFLRNDRLKSPLYTALAEQQVRDAPDDWKSHLELATVHMEAGSMEQARLCHEEAYRLHPCLETATAYAAYLLEADQPQVACALLERHMDDAAEPMAFLSRADAHATLGTAAMAMAQYDTAIRQYRLAVEAAPALLHTRARLVEALCESGQPDQGLAIAQAAVQAFPSQPDGWEAWGYAALRLGAADQACEVLNAALDIHPERPFAAYNLALAQQKCHRPVTAARTMALAASLDHRGALGPEVHARYGQTISMTLPAPDHILGPRGILHVVAHLSGGAAYVVSELVKALHPGFTQAVATLSSGEFSGERHAELIEALGIPVYRLQNHEQIAALQRQLSPALVIHRWWPTPRLPALTSQTGERLVLAAATPIPMPPGYDRYVTISTFQRQYQQLPSNKLVTIPNGVDVSAFGRAAPMEALWQHMGLGDPNLVRIVLASRLDHDKFYLRLPRILERIKDLPMAVLIAGRGPRRHEIEPELERLGLSFQVKFSGPLSQADIAGFLRSGHIGLHLTQTHQESHSLTLMQMMAAGLPVVAQPRGCIPEMIQHGVNGFLEPDESGIAQALERLVTDMPLRNAMAAQASALAHAYDISAFRSAWNGLAERECGLARPG